MYKSFLQKFIQVFGYKGPEQVIRASSYKACHFLGERIIFHFLDYFLDELEVGIRLTNEERKDLRRCSPTNLNSMSLVKDSKWLLKGTVNKLKRYILEHIHGRDAGQEFPILSPRVYYLR